MRLGALQKKLFIDGKRVGDREYAEVLIAITEYHRALLSGLWQISFPEKLSKTDGMNAVRPQTDRHSLSCIAMQ
ncbi:hypothetical protein BANRA_04866 [Escherichia coli]|nr:hypothetical protein BANRA_04866 [Escherichia coli]